MIALDTNLLGYAHREDSLWHAEAYQAVAGLAESSDYWPHLLEASRAVGPPIHDARVTAICCLHGVRALWTADRDFGRFSGLRIRNPLVG